MFPPAGTGGDKTAEHGGEFGLDSCRALAAGFLKPQRALRIVGKLFLIFRMLSD
jgi:hypothetical protein